MTIPFSYIGLMILIICVFAALYTGNLCITNPRLKSLPIILWVIGVIALIVSLKIEKNTFDTKINDEMEKLKQYEAKQQKIAMQMIDNGADVYIDGQLIDPTKIILDKYDITIVDDYVILSH